MNYVLSERTAAWLKRQMAHAQGYKPAAQAPSRLVRRDGAVAVSTKSICPLQVRFVPSAEEGADVGEGDYIIYVPAGSVVVNGVSLRSEDVPLSPYVAGAYANRPDWYSLPQMGDGDNVIVGISYDPEDGESPLLIDIYTGDPTEIDPEDGTVEREIIVANVSVTEPGEGTAGGVHVFQVVEGPLILEVGVETLNGAMGNLSVVGGKDGMTVQEGQKYWIKVEREAGSTAIEVSLTDVPPEAEPGEDDEGNYCNDVANDELGNDISGSGETGYGSGGGGVQGGNDISQWPCKEGEGS